MANCVAVCYDKQKSTKVLQYFEDGINVCVFPAARPKAGEVYLFSPGDDDTKKGEYCTTSL